MISTCGDIFQLIFGNSLILHGDKNRKACVMYYADSTIITQAAMPKAVACIHSLNFKKTDPDLFFIYGASS
jgi:hypothetical protein